MGLEKCDTLHIYLFERLIMCYEETLEIEYIESIVPPQKMSDFKFSHEDWV